MEITTRTLKQNIRLPVVVETLTIQINPPTVVDQIFANFWIRQYIEFQELIAKYSIESFFCGDDYNAFTCLLMDAKLLLLNQEISREDVRRFLNLMKTEVEILNEKLPYCYIVDQEIHILKATPKVALLTQYVNNAISLLN